MKQAIIFVFLGYAGLALLLLNLGLYTRWPVWVKTGCILLFGLLAITTYGAMNDLLGWPTRRDLPERFIFVSAWVDEPAKQGAAGGSIHIWAIDNIRFGPGGVPRAYTLDYDRSLHQQINEANQRSRLGIRQIGRIKPGDATRPARTTTSRFARDASIIEIYDLPDPELPEK